VQLEKHKWRSIQGEEKEAQTQEEYKAKHVERNPKSRPNRTNFVGTRLGPGLEE
jgi:hypothetical protein